MSRLYTAVYIVCAFQLSSCALDAGGESDDAVVSKLLALEDTASNPGEAGSVDCLGNWRECVGQASTGYQDCVARGGGVQTCDEQLRYREAACETTYFNCLRTSPIMIDFGARGFSLTDADHGVSFDLDGDGLQERTGWIACGAEDAFLARDLNANGRIDDGRELFGDSTELLDGTRAPHGYVALAELDLPEQGGNGNGFLERWDAGYHDLLLWNDFDHDGITQQSELLTLIERDVLALRLAYSESSETDAHGNRIAYVSVAVVREDDRVVKRATADVFFAPNDPQ